LVLPITATRSPPHFHRNWNLRRVRVIHFPASTWRARGRQSPLQRLWCCSASAARSARCARASIGAAGQGPLRTDVRNTRARYAQAGYPLHDAPSSRSTLPYPHTIPALATPSMSAPCLAARGGFCLGVLAPLPSPASPRARRRSPRPSRICARCGGSYWLERGSAGCRCGRGRW
jgi:hypothetical protein